MNQDKIKELRAHAGKLVAEGKPLSGVFERLIEYMAGSEPDTWWEPWSHERAIPDFTDGQQWRITQPKKQIIKWEHEYFKGCATNYGELYESPDNAYASTFDGTAPKSALRLAAPTNEDSNWQYFRSTPENDAKLLEMAKMVKVKVRFWNIVSNRYEVTTYSDGGWTSGTQALICNFRITGECQYGWTDKPEEARS